MGKRATKTEKLQAKSMIKILRPKVYITESSSFKKLVQELTGDDTKPLQIAEATLSIEDYSETSTEASAESLRSYNPMLYTDDHDVASTSQGYRDIESWLLDMEPFDPNCYNPVVQDQFTIYDYDLSQLL